MLQQRGNKDSSVTFAKLFLDEIAALYSGTSLVKKEMNHIHANVMTKDLQVKSHLQNIC